MTSRRALITHLALAFFTVSALSAGETQRFNLSDKPEKPRFQVTEKTWPAKVGEAEICLWHDDKLAALSLGVDDNFAGEIDWWKEKAKTYDFKVTWFVITGRITREGRSIGGIWPQFQELETLGHAVESHTVTHLHVEEPGWGTAEWDFTKGRAATAAARTAKPTDGMKPEDGSEGESVKPVAGGEANPAIDFVRGINWEYAGSIEQIEANIPGKKVSALAYPGGGNTKYNDRNVAAKYFRVARGATGAPNAANQTDYMSTNAMSGWQFGELPTGLQGNVNNIIDPNLYRGRYYRGWLILFAHGVSANPPLFDKTFEFIKQNREKLWIGLFTEVAKYGQERDTATLKVESPGPEKMTFLLTDEMDDSYFNYPLTIKVRIPDAWEEAAATQGDKAAETKVIEHEGAKYALVQAVPDAGLVTVVGK